MSTVKTVTSALTAVALVTGIGLAWAQTDDQAPPAGATPAAMPSEQTPADPNAVPAPVDNTAASQQQQQQADDPARQTPPADSMTAPMPLESQAASSAPTETKPAPAPTYEPAPRADRN